MTAVLALDLQDVVVRYRVPGESEPREIELWARDRVEQAERAYECQSYRKWVEEQERRERRAEKRAQELRWIEVEAETE